MPSGEANAQTPQSIIPNQAQPNQPVGNPGTGSPGPVSGEKARFVSEQYQIKGDVRPGDKPKDFINRLLNDSATAPTVAAPPVDPLAQVVAEVKAAVAPDVEFKKPVKADPLPEFGFEKKADAPAPEAEEALEEKVEPGSINESYKNLNKKFKETRTTLSQTQAEKDRLEKELEEYKTGAVVPAVLQQKEAEIERLSNYEKLFNFKGSSAYKEQFVKPLTQNDTELKSIFKDYEIPEEMIEKVESLTNRADRNRFLADHFDIVGADEVRRLLESRVGLKHKAKEVEAGSTQFIQEMEETQKRIEAQNDAQRKSKIAARAKDSWMKSLMKVRQEDRAPELILSETDEDHNERIVRPLLTQAATEYGKMVTYLAEQGIKDLPEELAQALALSSLYSHSFAIGAATRDAALKHAEAAEQATRIGNGYYRPNVGGGQPSIGGTGGNGQKPKQSLEQGMDGLLNNVLSKR